MCRYILGKVINNLVEFMPQLKEIFSALHGHLDELLGETSLPIVVGLYKLNP